MYKKIIASKSYKRFKRDVSNLKIALGVIENILLEQHQALKKPLFNFFKGEEYRYNKERLEIELSSSYLRENLARIKSNRKVFFPKECKPNENRFILTTELISVFSRAKVPMVVQKGAGLNVGLSDSAIRKQVKHHEGKVTFVNTVAQGLKAADMIYMVKEPYGEIRKQLLNTKNKIIFSYLHPLAPSSIETTKAMKKRGHIGISFDMIPQGLCLTPMSIIAAKKTIEQFRNLDAVSTKKTDSTPPITAKTLGVIPGFPAGNTRENTVLILGVAGTAGQTAAIEVLKAGGKVIGLDISTESFKELKKNIPEKLRLRIDFINSAKKPNYAKLLKEALYVVDAVKIPGKPTPTIITEAMQSRSRNIYGVIAVDEGGAIENAPNTSNQDPWAWKHNSLYYTSPNMPSTKPVEASSILALVTAPYALLLAKLGPTKALASSEFLQEALVYQNGEYGSDEIAEEIEK
ncbi:hypothetical protein ACFL5G_02790 [Candidatus Margulisiibacteriota bacterium]